MATPTWKKRLEPFGELYLKMHSLIVEMGDDELHNLINACDKPSQTNCGWHVHEIAPLVKREAQQEIAHRAYVRDEAQRDKVKPCA